MTAPAGIRSADLGRLPPAQGRPSHRPGVRGRARSGGAVREGSSSSLSFVGSAEDLSQQDLSERLGLDPTIVVGLVDALEERQWMTRDATRRRTAAAGTAEPLGETARCACRTAGRRGERSLKTPARRGEPTSPCRWTATWRADERRRRVLMRTCGSSGRSDAFGARHVAGPSDQGTRRQPGRFRSCHTRRRPAGTTGNAVHLRHDLTTALDQARTARPMVTS